MKPSAHLPHVNAVVWFSPDGQSICFSGSLEVVSLGVGVSVVGTVVGINLKVIGNLISKACSVMQR